jgi:hypothetical protein
LEHFHTVGIAKLVIDDPGKARPDARAPGDRDAATGGAKVRIVAARIPACNAIGTIGS